MGKALNAIMAAQHMTRIALHALLYSGLLTYCLTVKNVGSGTIGTHLGTESYISVFSVFSNIIPMLLKVNVIVKL